MLISERLGNEVFHRRFHRRISTMGVGVACALLLASCSSGSRSSSSEGTASSSGPAIQWSSNRQSTPVGGGWKSISCTGPRSCTVVGGSGNATTAVLENGIWGAPETIPGATMGGLLSVSCSSNSDCTAVGAGPPAGSSQGVAAAPVAFTKTHGVWSAANSIIGASSNGFGGGMTSVSCLSIGNCIASGEDGAGPFVVQQTGGMWQPLSRIGGRSGSFNSVSCSAPICFVVGSSGRSPNGPLSELLRDGTWVKATFGAGPLESISCWGFNQCVVVGNGSDGAFYQMDYNGIWSSASPLQFERGLTVRSVSCIPRGNGGVCVAIASDNSTSAAALIQPSSAMKPSPISIPNLSSISCVPGNTCWVVGTTNTNSTASSVAISLSW